MVTDDLEQPLPNVAVVVEEESAVAVPLIGGGEQVVRVGGSAVFSGHLAALPPVAKLTQVQTLRVNHTPLAALPGDLGLLGQRLVVLDVAHNRLTELPASLGLLGHLETLLVGSNALTVLPDLSGLQQLVTLDVSGNQLVALPSSLGHLSRLLTLNAYNNLIEAVPPELGRLSLSTLNLGVNRISRIPDELAQMANLRELYLYGNSLMVLSDALCSLVKLTTLDLYNNQITLIPPDALSSLVNLREFNAAQNRLCALPDTIGNLEQLTELHLDGNNLTALPDSIGKLLRLKELDLYSNRLQQLPQSIGYLVNLRALNLRLNRELAIVPETLGNLVSIGNPFDEAAGDTIGQLRGRWQRTFWSRRFHRLFGRACDEAIGTSMLVWRRLNRGRSVHIPLEIWEYILSFLVRRDFADDASPGAMDQLPDAPA